MTEDSEESEEESEDEGNSLLKKFSATAKVALALGSTSSRYCRDMKFPPRLFYVSYSKQLLERVIN